MTHDEETRLLESLQGQAKANAAHAAGLASGFAAMSHQLETLLLGRDATAATPAAAGAGVPLAGAERPAGARSAPERPERPRPAPRRPQSPEDALLETFDEASEDDEAAGPSSGT